MAATEVFANLPSTTVVSGGTSAPAPGTSESWTVSDSTSFPSVTTGTTQCHVADIVANSEIILVTNISGATWTVTRGAEGTTPVTHTAGFTVNQVTSAGALGSFVQTAGSWTMAGPLSVSSSLGVGASAPSGAGLNVIGTATSQLVYVEQQGSAGHCMTLNLTGTGGTTQAALNAVSANSAFTCVEISGVETSRGTLKITHHGYADGSDSGAAAISIDMQTSTGGSTGTTCGGIFLTSTTDSTYASNVNLFLARFNGLDEFVIKSQGVVGICVPTSHVPSGMLEIAQKDTSTPGLYMQAIASGTDMVTLKDSGGTLRFQVSNAGNTFLRATAFMTTNMQVGSASNNLGGGGNGCIGMNQASAVPTSNPSSNGIVLYVDGSGNLLCRTSAGNVRTVAAV